MEKLFFDGFMPLLRILIAVPIVYFAVIVFVRISGKRTTGQMNGFDWIVTVAMGSLVASAISSRSIARTTRKPGVSLAVLDDVVGGMGSRWSSSGTDVRSRSRSHIAGRLDFSAHPLAPAITSHSPLSGQSIYAKAGWSPLKQIIL